MSDRIFIDTNILVYSFDKKDKAKQETAKRLLGELFDKDNYFISIQVLNEFSSAAIRKLNPPLSMPDVMGFISSFPEKKILPVNKDTVLYALEIMEKYKLSYWDSLITATSLKNGCTHVYTEDMHDGLIIETNLKIFNPF